MLNLSANLYQALAETLAEPPEWMTLPGCEWPLFNAAMDLADDSPAVRKHIEDLTGIRPESLDARQARYAALMRPEKGIWLSETGALYGRIIGDATFELARLYKSAGLETVDAELPDHASLELAFLAHLAMHEPKAEKLFIQQHAGRWMPALGEALARSGDPVYAPLGRLLVDWLAERTFGRRKLVKRQQVEGALVPSVPNVADCTLCGFCVQVCPTHVLTLRENEQETLLALRHDATCVSCHKCEKICETDAIEMVAVTKREALVPLVRSERPACKHCGKPLISGAELAYMARQLENPDWLYYCLDCRPLLIDGVIK